MRRIESESRNCSPLAKAGLFIYFFQISFMPNAIRYNPDASKLERGMMKQVIEGLGANSGLNAKAASTVEEGRKLPAEQLKTLLRTIPQS